MLLGDVPAEAVTVTVPVALSFGEAAAALSRGSGRRIVHVDRSVEQMREELLAFGVPPAYAETLLGLFAALREGRSDGLSDAVERITGTAPRSLQVYAQDHAATLRGAAAAA